MKKTLLYNILQNLILFFQIILLEVHFFKNLLNLLELYIILFQFIFVLLQFMLILLLHVIHLRYSILILFF